MRYNSMIFEIKEIGIDYLKKNTSKKDSEQVDTIVDAIRWVRDSLMNRWISFLRASIPYETYVCLNFSCKIWYAVYTLWEKREKKHINKYSFFKNSNFIHIDHLNGIELYWFEWIMCTISYKTIQCIHSVSQSVFQLKWEVHKWRSNCCEIDFEYATKRFAFVV